mgnify:CR=1 FL=1
MKPTHIEHIGIAVKSLEEAIPFYENVLGLKCYAVEEVKDQKVKTEAAERLTVSLRTVRWGGTLLPQAIGRAMEWPDSRPKRKLPTHRLDRLAGCRHSERIFWMPAPARENTLIIKTPFMIFITRHKVVSPVCRGK